MSAQFGVALHPKYNLFWSDWPLDRIKVLRQHVLDTGEFDGRTLTVGKEPVNKRMLEDLGAIHTVEGERLRIAE